MNKLEISEIQVVPIKPLNGLVGFSSCVIGNQYFVGNIAIYTSPNTRNGFRLVFPNKKLVSGQVVECFYPINKEAGEHISSEIIKKYVELMDNFYHVKNV